MNSEKFINRNFAKKLLKNLIGIDSCQPKGNEKKMVEEILKYFPEKISKSIIEHGDERETLVIKIHGEVDCGGVAFLGHTDTVSFGDLGKWKYDPLLAVEESGYIYGRGAADMKGGVSAMIMTALNIIESRIKPKEPIYFCFTADEESGGLGAKALNEQDCLNSVNEFFITEPTSEFIGICEKGALWLKVKTTGRLAHGSRKELGINAIEKSIEFQEKLIERIDTVSRDKYLGCSSIAITKLNGGIMTNVIPAYSEMEIDIRTISGVEHEEILKTAIVIARTMERESENNLKIEIEILNDRPALSIDENELFIKKIESVCIENNLKATKKGLFFYTDASQIIPRMKVPFVILGPGEDSMAHQVDENIEIDSVVRMALLYFEYIKKYYLGGK